jgi:hypothetical protein
MLVTTDPGAIAFTRSRRGPVRAQAGGQGA